MTTDELNKLIEDEAKEYCASKNGTHQSSDSLRLYWAVHHGAKIVASILMPEIERLEINALKENEVIIRLTRERDEFTDRMIKAEISLGKQAPLWEKENTTLKEEIARLKAKNEKLIR